MCLEVLERPVLSQLTPVTISEGENAFFEVKVSGIPEPDVEWYIASKSLKASEKVLLSKEENDHFLELCSCEVHQSGTVTVKASNKAGEVTQEAILTVNGGLSSIIVCSFNSKIGS